MNKQKLKDDIKNIILASETPLPLTLDTIIERCGCRHVFLIMNMVDKLLKEKVIKIVHKNDISDGLKIGYTKY